MRLRVHISMLALAVAAGSAGAALADDSEGGPSEQPRSSERPHETVGSATEGDGVDAARAAGQELVGDSAHGEGPCRARSSGPRA